MLKAVDSTLLLGSDESGKLGKLLNRNLPEIVQTPFQLIASHDFIDKFPGLLKNFGELRKTGLKLPSSMGRILELRQHGKSKEDAATHREHCEVDHLALLPLVFRDAGLDEYW
jgi:hypothetical protein